MNFKSRLNSRVNYYNFASFVQFSSIRKCNYLPQSPTQYKKVLLETTVVQIEGARLLAALSALFRISTKDYSGPIAAKLPTTKSLHC